MPVALSVFPRSLFCLWPQVEFLTSPQHFSLRNGSKKGRKIATALKDGKLTAQQADLIKLTLLRDMLCAVQYLHAQREMLHFNLKPSNFFIDRKGSARVGDFGTALPGLHQEMRDFPVKNPLWLASEAALPMKRQMEEGASAQDRSQTIHYAISQKSDIWSLGACAYELWYGRRPFGESDLAIDTLNRIDSYSKLETQSGRRDFLNLTTAPFDAWIGDMLDPDPERRPDPDAVLQGKAFADPVIGSPAIRKLMTQL